jgi:glycerophosphoryl diester phosphodiesterase
LLNLKPKAEVKRKYKRFVLLGTGGVGKSTALATIAKKPLVIDLDGRFPVALVDKADVLNVPASYEDVLKTLHGLVAEKTLAHDWLQIDTATKVMGIVEDYTIVKDCGGQKDKYNAYGYGLKFSPQYFKEILDVVDAIQAKHGINVAFICHSKVKNFQNPMTEAYTKNVLDLPDAVADKLKQWADYVGYAYFEVDVDKEKKKASGEPRRFISFVESPLYEAKNSSDYDIPKRVAFDKEGKWAQVVFGETQHLIKVLRDLIQQFPEAQKKFLEEQCEAVDVWSFGVEELQSFITAGKAQLNQKGA